MAVVKIYEDLYRILVPFEDIYTTVYVAVYEPGAAVIDSGTSAWDVDTHIHPALTELGLGTDQIRYLLLTHSHEDHAGGIARLAELFPSAEIRAACEIPLVQYAGLADNEILLGHLQVIHLPGHTQNSVGFLDLSTRTLLSGDCLQLNGISKYRNNIVSPELYTRSVEKLKTMHIHKIAAAHEFEPIGSIAEGDAAVQEYLEMCLHFRREMQERV